jgi:hypothetical protein
MLYRYRSTWPVLAALLSAAGAAGASDVPTLPEVVVNGGHGALLGVADSATEGTVGAAQIANRPLLRAAEVIETIPGMIVTQHSGDGKANQYFLRGFNLDHGSDFATSVEGVPVNIVSHGHGQGYMDLNFVMPELIDSVRYRKGVYAAEDGDFSNTGSARITYQRKLDAPFADLTIGAHRFRRALLAGSATFDRGDLLGALEVAGNDGPWDQPEALRKVNGLLRWSGANYSVSAQAYKSRWNATEDVPERAITDGQISRFGALSANDGGVTHRYSLSGRWSQGDEAGTTKLSAYVVDYGLNLFSAPSGFISGPQGDQHEQADDRLLWGGEAQRAWQFGAHELTLGAQLRRDDIRNVGLYQTVNRQRVNTVRQDRATETEAGMFAAIHSEWQPWLRTTIGLRHDRINADVGATGGQFNVANGGAVSAAQTSPKLSIVITPLARTELYANWGYGFHSNDVRGATSSVNPADGEAVDKLGLFAKANGAEFGVRSELLPGWTSSLSLWRMSIASELVFVGDEGVTEARGASRRHGIEWSNYIRPFKGLIIDADVAFSNARFRQPQGEGAGGTMVPNAIPRTASLGVSADLGGAWFGGLRTRYIGAYALEETGRETSRPLLTTNLKLGYRIGRGLQVALDVLNLFGSSANDIEYWGGACTRGEQSSGACNGGIDGRLIHPLEPRTLRLSLRNSF